MGIGLVIDKRSFGLGIECEIPQGKGFILRTKIAIFAIYIIIGV